MHSGEFAKVMCNQRYTEADGMGGNEGVHGADSTAFLFQFRADCSAGMGGFFIKGGDDKVEQEFFEQGEVSLAPTPFLCAIAEFKCHDAGEKIQRGQARIDLSLINRGGKSCFVAWQPA